MDEQDLKFIFHLYRTEGQSLILHPFRNAKELKVALENKEIEGRYGAEPTIDLLTKFRRDLHHLVETAVRQFLSDSRFVPRFLVSAGVFFATFVILSYAVPDPILIIDELVFAAAASIGLYLFWGRRDNSSDVATEKRVDLRSKVDRIKFVPSSLLKQFEQDLLYVENRNIEEKLEFFNKTLEEERKKSPSKSVFPSRDREEAKQFISLLEQKFQFKRFQRKEKSLLERLSRKNSDREQLLRRWSNTGNIDFPLYANYKRFKHTVEHV